MKASETPKECSVLIVGTRMIIRSKTDWRFASVSRVDGEIAVLNVCSPTGRTYRLRRNKDQILQLDGPVPTIVTTVTDAWQENLSRYDSRW